MSINISPRQRVDQFPGELGVKSGKLVCVWCNDKPLNHSRRDQILDHIRTKAHQDNRVANGAKMSYDFESKEALERKERRRKILAKIHMKKMRRSKAAQRRSEDTVASLRKLFEDSDSDSGASFEGFESPPRAQVKHSESEYDSRRSGRSRKRPARLSESFDDDNIAKIGKIADQAAFISSMARKQRASEEYSSPSESDQSQTRIRSMPIKKQISFSAKHSDSTSTSSPGKGSLKIKFKRSAGTSGQYGEKPEKKLKVVSKSGPGKGLKLKFVWKKKLHSTSSNNTETEASNTQSSTSLDEANGYEEMLKGIEESLQDNSATPNVEEVVEEEIVEMKEEEVVQEEDLIPMKMEPPEVKTEPPEVPQHNEHDTQSVPSTDMKPQKRAATLKKVRTEPEARLPKPKVKKQVARDDRKRKMTGYMLWAKQTRESVSRKYPGLEFGDVSKKLGDLWKRMPEKEKQMWKYRNTKMVQNKRSQPAVTLRKSGSKMIETGPKKKPPRPKVPAAPASPPVKNPESAMRQELSRLPPPSIEPLDSAAYLSLLGESFSKLSAKTRKVESEVVIQGTETVLLDSLVCALAPLISLTRQVPELNDAISQKTLSNCLSNIAHIMPGL